MRIHIFILLCLIFLIDLKVIQAKQLNKVELNDDNYLLLAIELNGDTVSNSVDAYQHQGQVFLAIEPLFNSLNLRYQLRTNNLLVWKNEEKFSFDLSTLSATNTQLFWADDGYYQFISEQVLTELFDVTLELIPSKLLLNISTKDYLFPVTIIEQQRKARFKNKAFSYQNDSAGANNIQSIPITVEDQYHLITMPHGEIFSTVEYSDRSSSNRTSVQLTSDLLYHSARINLSKSKGSDISGGVTLSRYKTSPNNRILGAFDFYSFGDVSSYSSGTILNGQSGLGFNIQRSPANYRQSNSKIDIQQQVPPGWEAELFLNNRLVTTATSPDTGLLVFTDVDIQYGRNDFVIKVYGPFGETEEYNQSFPLRANPLSAGDMAYGLYALDNGKSLFNDTNDLADFKLDSVGGAFNYGINDTWQLGTAFQNVYDVSTQEYSQYFGVKNFLSFPGFLVESDITVNNDESYTFSTSLSGRLFGDATYQVEVESIDGMNANSFRVDSEEKSTRLTASYFDYAFNLPIQFNTSFIKTDTTTGASVANNFFYNFQRLRLSHRLTYSSFDTNFNGTEISRSSLNGTLGITGAIIDNFRLSAEINYDPRRSSPILDSSRLIAQYKWTDPFELKHYFTFNYQPLTETGDWRLSHSLAFETSDYRLSLRSNYNSTDAWSFGLNINFFLGYDYYNQTARTSSNISGQTATLNVHSYLDRHLNGVPDVLDYPLENVTFFGENHWQDIRSNEDGKTLLHGARVNSPLRFGATWQNGSQTVNNDYVVYTHAGARIDVNMPFYLTTELSGFVYRQSENSEYPVSQLSIVVVNDKGEEINKTLTDDDGYYEFLNVHPNSYTVQIDKDIMHAKALTTDVIGFNMTTPNNGGFIELPTFYVFQQSDVNEFRPEIIERLVMTEDNVEPLVWDNNPQKRQNLFTLPTNKKLHAEHVLPEHKTLSLDNQDKQKLDNEPLPKKESTLTIPPRKDALKETMNAEYTLQLGSFLLAESAEKFIVSSLDRLSFKPSLIKLKNNELQSVYKVFYGRFSKIDDAKIFAENLGLAPDDYLIKPLSQEASDQLDVTDTSPITENQTSDKVTKNTTLLKNWVIQFYASKSQISQENAEPFKSIGELFIAEKGISENEKWICLISQGFENKQEALQALEESKLSGWVNSSAAYRNAVKVNE